MTTFLVISLIVGMALSFYLSNKDKVDRVKDQLKDLMK